MRNYLRVFTPIGQCSRDGGPLFCGVLLSDNERIKDNAFVARIRSYLGIYLDLNLFQSVMINNWEAEIPDKMCF
ncbi:hypothetical protein VB264_09310 [Arcicella aquatica]|uniref:Uncharacterized protein n=1 Tax=Arcicella aquatica TaxID=217141 RepID=A0ABU5QLN5_9BACT|nr:hypothetical protein [Arcicella aquatica]MEA5257983.1 hypothetical protein [Arcicella aquatica]